MYNFSEEEQKIETRTTGYYCFTRIKFTQKMGNQS